MPGATQIFNSRHGTARGGHVANGQGMITSYGVTNNVTCRCDHSCLAAGETL